VFDKEIRHIITRKLAEWAEGQNGRALRLTQQGIMLGNQAFMEFV